jgi:epoxyqueuosine reductase
VSATAPSADPAALTERLKAQAYGVGFDLAGVTALGVPDSVAHFDAWLAAGHHGPMAYLDGAGAELRRDSRRPHPGATHALVVALDYGGKEPPGPVARYARGDDYHEVLREKLRALHAWFEEQVGHPVDGRPYVDSGPLLERDLARRAGLGWFGKNTLLINPTRGSFFFLGALVLAWPLVPDAPFEADRCGRCTRCLDACPTQAFVAPRVLDARRCISTLTIELRGEIDAALAPLVGERLYGCDVCQEVCPYNGKFSKPVTEHAFASRKSLEGKDARSMALWLLSLSRSEYSAAFKGSPMKRAKFRGLKRNAAVVLGNMGFSEDVPSLISALSDEEPLVRGHAAWALGRIATSAALPAIDTALLSETDSAARAELSAAAQSILVRSSPSESK